MPDNNSNTNQTAEQAEDQHLGQILVDNNVGSALTPADSQSVVATVAGLIQGVLGGGNSSR